MRVAGIRQLRAQSASFLGGAEPVLVTKHGRISGLYLPLDEADRIPADIRRELAVVLGNYLSKSLSARRVSERQVIKDFRAYRKRRR